MVHSTSGVDVHWGTTAEYKSQFEEEEEDQFVSRRVALSESDVAE